MFGSLTEKFQNLFSSLSRNKELSEKNIADAVRDVRLALLDADVSYTVVSRFIKSVKEKVVGYERIKGVKATEQFISLVHEELIHLMGGDEVKLKILLLVFFVVFRALGKQLTLLSLLYFSKRKNFRKDLY